ncbi:MAG TPA: leucyl aminopeptidase [Candidatus Limnocylindrales bacterium]|nr:leucyl aminopeptidase [Candidatus Limnocylindrales bacterium]
MSIKLVRRKASQVQADLVAIGVVDGQELKGAVTEFGKDERDTITARARRLSFKGKVNSSMIVQLGDRDVALVGVGKGDTADSWRRAASSARNAATVSRAATFAFALDDAARPLDVLGPVVEGIGLTGYSYEKYKTRKSETSYGGPRAISVTSPSLSESGRAAETLAYAQEVCDAVFFARDLVNEMPTAKPPGYLASVARQIARGNGRLRCDVWQGERLRREKMNGIIAVSSGSKNSGALIKLVYKPRRRARARVALIGKGITFDSGGLSLKPAKSMETMKMDMSGAALVLAVMRALPALEPAVEVHGFVASAENMPGQNAQKPGDIIRYRNGVTAEVLNTDAEGRLVLADALCLAGEIEPDYIVDAATLTGACMVALGLRIGGIMGTDQALVDDLIAIGREAGEGLWQLPLVEDYAEEIRSPIADIKNIGGGYAGTIAAALFLRHFVGKNKWAHLDIAGPAWTDRALPYTPRGGTGFAIRTVLGWLDKIG